MKVEFEFEIEKRTSHGQPGFNSDWPKRVQGIDHIGFTTKDGYLSVEGWYDSIASWGADVWLSPQNRRDLAQVLLADLPDRP